MNNKPLPIIYFLVSLIFYILCVIKFFSSGPSGGLLWLFLGSAFLYFGTNEKNKM